MTNLPALEGTEKQIAWASSIRDKALAGNKVLNKATIRMMLSMQGVSAAEAQDHLVALFDAQRAAREELEQQASASWWIDNRDRVGRHVAIALQRASEQAFPNKLGPR